MNLVEIIRKIGENGGCNEEELMLLLPDFPTLSGSEFIFRVKWKELITELKSNDDIKFFIKGLHLIEIKYKIVTQNKFGFGSPSSTLRLLKYFQSKEHSLSLELLKWIKENDT